MSASQLVLRLVDIDDRDELLSDDGMLPANMSKSAQCASDTVLALRCSALTTLAVSWSNQPESTRFFSAARSMVSCGLEDGGIDGLQAQDSYDG